MSIEHHHDLQQNTDEWFDLRLGVVTASNMKLLLTSKLKIANNDKVRSYAYEIAAQRETKHIEDSYQGEQMIRGHIEEDIARDLYSNDQRPVEQCGFITNDSLGFIVGCSPDGLVRDTRMIEIKSRIQKHQLKTIVENKMPEEYKLQVQAQLFVSGRETCDFVSYSNGMPLFVETQEVDLEYQDAIKEALIKFEADVEGLRSVYRDNSKGLIVADRYETISDDAIMTGSAE